MRGEHSQAMAPPRPTILLRPPTLIRLGMLRASPRRRTGPQSPMPALKSKADPRTRIAARASRATLLQDRENPIGKRQANIQSEKMPRHVIAGAG